MTCIIGHLVVHLPGQTFVFAALNQMKFVEMWNPHHMKTQNFASIRQRFQILEKLLPKT